MSDERPSWHCEDCGWEWPLRLGPKPGDECDNCGGELREVEAAMSEPHPFDPYSEEAPEHCVHCGQPEEASIHDKGADCETCGGHQKIRVGSYADDDAVEDCPDCVDGQMTRPSIAVLRDD